jgi:acetyl-CoA C-acetyltransferase
VPPAELGAQVIKALLDLSGVQPDQISEVIMGRVLTAGVGQNPARQPPIHAGLPDTVPGMNIGNVCGSGLKAKHLAVRCAQDAHLTGRVGLKVSIALRKAV